MTKIKIRMIFYRSFFLILVVFVSNCIEKDKEDFFLNLKGANISMKMTPNSYFIKSFGINSKSLIIDNRSFWRLHDEKDSYFYIDGYLRNDGDSITILPVDYRINNKKPQIYKLFDFTLNHKESWNMIFKLNSEASYCNGYTVTFLNKHSVKNDMLFEYLMTQFMYHKRTENYDYQHYPTFYITVSKVNGIMNIKRLNDINQTVIYEASIYPQQKFVNNSDNRLMDL